MATGAAVAVGVVVTWRVHCTFFTVGVVAGQAAAAGVAAGATTCTAREIVGDGLYFSGCYGDVVHNSNIGYGRRDGAGRSAVYVCA